MRTIEVNNQALSKEFIEFPVRLYKGDKNWIRPLDKDIAFVFDRKQNKYFQDGDAIRWLLKNSHNQTIGRIAAFYHQKTSGQSEQPTGGIGFFECINDQEAANMLFDQSKDWLKSHGYEAMDGPINFGDRNEWWGLLVDGFYEPNYGMPYNFKYYKELFENYGFQIYFKQYTYHRTLKDPSLPPLVEKKAEKFAKRPGYHFRHIKKAKLTKYTSDFRYVYNKAWENFKDVSEMSEDQALSLLMKVKPIMDERLIWLGYYEDEPIAIFVMIPEMNQLFKYVNGKLNNWNKLKIYLLKKLGFQTKALGLLFGVIPKFQGKGIEGALIKAFTKIAEKPTFPYKDLEMNWIGDFNPQMMHVAEQVGGKIKKIHHTYRIHFYPKESPNRAHTQE